MGGLLYVYRVIGRLISARMQFVVGTCAAFSAVRCEVDGLLTWFG